MIPYPAKPWTQAKRIVGARPPVPLAGLQGKAPSFDRNPLYNDFCLTQSAAGRWHCIGILFEGSSKAQFRQDRLFHYVADSVEGPYHWAGYVDLGYGQGAGVWAPYIVRDGERTLMYYAHEGVRIAQAEDKELQKWHRIAASQELVATEEGARDPLVIKDERTGLYLLYYVCALQKGDDWDLIVRVKTSTDLLSWSEPRTVLHAPPGYGSAESVFVLQENGHYYMWISASRDYGVLSLYISQDPFNFGDATANRIEEQLGHAAEIVQANGRYWMACVAIASVRGLDSANDHDMPVAQHDIEGVWLQPLEWRPATQAMQAKVVRATQ